jgi:putative transcriptional regulator
MPYNHSMIENRLSRIMGERRLSIAQLARESGIAYSTLHPLYTGKAKRIDLKTLDRLCDALDVSVCDVFERQRVET